MQPQQKYRLGTISNIKLLNSVFERYEKQEILDNMSMKSKPINIVIWGLHMYTIFLLVRNKDCGYSLEPPRKHRLCHTLEPPRRGGSNEYPHSLFWVNENSIDLIDHMINCHFIHVGSHWADFSFLIFPKCQVMC